MAGGRLVLPAADPVLTSANLLDVGAMLTVYDTGTTNLSLIYADVTLVTPIANPQTSNSAGRFYTQGTQICALNSAAYDVVLTLTDGEVFNYTALYPIGAAQNLSLYALINSPAFTGTPTAPTPGAADNSSKIATTAFVATAIATATGAISVFPAGMVAAFAMSSPPTGWLICDGSSQVRATYPALFTAIGTTWGSADGTHFTLPDMRGYFLRGYDATGTVDPGSTFAATEQDSLQGHYHGPGGTGGSFEMSAGGSGTVQTGSGSSTNTQTNTGAAVTDGTNGTPRVGTQTRPLGIVALWCIKT